MSETSHTPRRPAEWREQLERSKAQIEAGQVLPLLAVLEELRASAERLEAEMGIAPDEMQSNPAG